MYRKIIIYELQSTVISELTDGMLQEISRALRPQPAEEVLSEGFRIRIQRQDMATLGGLNWLNDEV